MKDRKISPVEQFEMLPESMQLGLLRAANAVLSMNVPERAGAMQAAHTGALNASYTPGTRGLMSGMETLLSAAIVESSPVLRNQLDRLMVFMRPPEGD